MPNPNSAIDLAVPLLGALWGCGTLVLQLTMEANRVRDRVILAHDEEHRIPVEHREHLMWCDWLPDVIFATLLVVAFAALASGLPYLLSDPAQRAAARPIACIVSSVAIIAGLVYAPTAWGDWRAMRKAIERHKANEGKSCFHLSSISKREQSPSERSA